MRFIGWNIVDKDGGKPHFGEIAPIFTRLFCSTKIDANEIMRIQVPTSQTKVINENIVGNIIETHVIIVNVSHISLTLTKENQEIHIEPNFLPRYSEIRLRYVKTVYVIVSSATKIGTDFRLIPTHTIVE